MAQMELPDIDVEGRVVIMTGADRGLGRAMSLGLAEKGARLVLASPVMDGLNAVAEEIAAIAGPGRALAVETDITDLDSCANCLRAAVDAFGVLHVLVNNARRLQQAGQGSGLLSNHSGFIRCSVTSWHDQYESSTPVLFTTSPLAVAAKKRFLRTTRIARPS
jgi:NAD(P)-dependent dehydrogenase (short-subunit alcohol dehydrogenase family)